MISALLAYVFPYAVAWLVVFNTIYSQNGFDTMLTVELDWAILLVLISYIFSMLCAYFTIESARDGGAWVITNSEGESESYSGVQFVIYYIGVLITAPFYIIYGLVKGIINLFTRNKEEWDKKTLVCGLIALLAAAYPFYLQASAMVKYDCNQLEYELVDVSSKVWVSEWSGSVSEVTTYFEVEATYPQKAVSAIVGTIHIYLDGEEYESVSASEIINPKIQGLIFTKPGAGEDADKVYLTFSISQKKNIIDFEKLFKERSDRLEITFELGAIAFNGGMVTASSEKYIESIDIKTVYSAEEHIANNDMTDENLALYNSAIELYNNKKYTEALEIFKEIPFYSEVKNYISLCENALLEEKYLSALDLLNENRYDEAIEVFEKLGGYKDAAAKIEECISKRTEAFYLSAIEKYNSDKFLEAFSDFSDIKDYKESADYIVQIKGKITDIARSSAANGKYTVAIDMLSEIGTSDEDELYVACKNARDGDYGPIVKLLNLKKIIVEEGVEIISDAMFFKCEKMVEVILPSTVTHIGYRAFYGCSSLEKINLPSGLVSIAGEAFGGCTSLTEITLPVSLKTLGKEPFSNCTSLQKINTPFHENISIVSLFATANHKKTAVPTSLTEIEITSGNVIPERFFCELPATVTTIVYTEPIVEIGPYAFENSDLDISIPTTVKKIGDGAFYGMPSVKEIVIPEGVEEIGNDVFGGNTCLSLETVYLPSTLKKIGSHCFCINPESYYYSKHTVKEIYFSGTKEAWLLVNSTNWNKDMRPGKPSYSLICTDSVCSFSSSYAGNWE